MKKVYYFLLLLSAVSLSVSVQAQPKKGSWGGHITVRSGGMLTDWALAFINPTRVAPAWLGTVVEHDYRNFPMWAAIYPTSETQRLNNDVGDEEVRTLNPRWWKGFLWPDFDRNYNVAVGYSVEYHWVLSGLALAAGVRYEWQGLCVPEGEIQGMHRMQNVVPSLEITKRLFSDIYYKGVFEKKVEDGWSPYDFNLFLVGNVSYVKNVDYKNTSGINTAVAGSGIRLAAGLGYEVLLRDLSHVLDWESESVKGVYFCTDVRYEHDCYNLFDVPGLKTRMGRFIGSVSLRF